jgi:hypothetical protein
MTIPAQQYAEIVKPGDYALQFHAVDQKHRYRRFLLSHMVEKDVLQVLCFF